MHARLLLLGCARASGFYPLQLLLLLHGWSASLSQARQVLDGAVQHTVCISHTYSIQRTHCGIGLAHKSLLFSTRAGFSAICVRSFVPFPRHSVRAYTTLVNTHLTLLEHTQTTFPHPPHTCVLQMGKYLLKIIHGISRHIDQDKRIRRLEEAHLRHTPQVQHFRRAQDAMQPRSGGKKRCEIVAYTL